MLGLLILSAGLIRYLVFTASNQPDGTDGVLQNKCSGIPFQGIDAVQPMGEPYHLAYHPGQMVYAHVPITIIDADYVGCASQAGVTLFSLLVSCSSECGE